MATTTQVTVTREWQMLHSDICVVQSQRRTEFFRFAGSETQPVGDIGVLRRIDDGPTVDMQGPVWCRLPQNSRNESEIVTVIKGGAQ